jgi:hypothetical protein
MKYWLILFFIYVIQETAAAARSPEQPQIHHERPYVPMHIYDTVYSSRTTRTSSLRQYRPSRNGSYFETTDYVQPDPLFDTHVYGNVNIYQAPNESSRAERPSSPPPAYSQYYNG